MEHLSVIFAVFNGERYLGEAVESVLAQSHAPHEVIVVDDGSTDGSADVATGFGAPVSVVRQPNRGQPAALNVGLARASGSLIAFLDADDIWEPEKAARQAARFAARPELEYCLTRIRNFLSPEIAARREQLDPDLFEAKPGFSVCTLMARRRLFDRLGPFDTSLRHASKTSWFLRAREAGATFEHLPEVLVRRRLHAANISQTAAHRSVDEYLALLKDSLDRRRRGTA